MHMYMYLSLCIYMYMYIYIYTYIHTYIHYPGLGAAEPAYTTPTAIDRPTLRPTCEQP